MTKQYTRDIRRQMMSEFGAKQRTFSNGILDAALKQNKSTEDIIAKFIGETAPSKFSHGCSSLLYNRETLNSMHATISSRLTLDINKYNAELANKLTALGASYDNKMINKKEYEKHLRKALKTHKRKSKMAMRTRFDQNNVSNQLTQFANEGYTKVIYTTYGISCQQCSLMSGTEFAISDVFPGNPTITNDQVKSNMS